MPSALNRLLTYSSRCCRLPTPGIEGKSIGSTSDRSAKKPPRPTIIHQSSDPKKPEPFIKKTSDKMKERAVQSYRKVSFTPNHEADTAFEFWPRASKKLK